MCLRSCSLRHRHARTHCDCPFISYDLCRLAPHIPDYAEVGAYSQSLQAMVYNSVAASLPTLLVMSVFGDDDLSSTLQYSRSAGWPVAALLDQPRVRPLFYRSFPPPSAETFCLFVPQSSTFLFRCRRSLPAPVLAVSAVPLELKVRHGTRHAVVLV